MKFVHLFAILAISEVVQSGIINELTVNTELNSYTDRVRIIYSLLAEECPDWRQHDIQKRNVLISSDHLYVEKRLYNELMDELIQCRNRNRPRPTAITTTRASTSPATTPTTKTPTIPPITATTTTTAPTTTTTPSTTTEQITTSTTTKSPTTTRDPSTSLATEPTAKSTVTMAKPLPSECRYAVNLTGSWRLDHSAHDLKAGGPHNDNGYACDLHTTDWFRISGDGGSRILNKCAPELSCGTRAPMWTNGSIPNKVGERVETEFYWTCSASESAQLSVVRCSDHPNDLVYKQHYFKDHNFLAVGGDQKLIEIFFIKKESESDFIIGK